MISHLAWAIAASADVAGAMLSSHLYLRRSYAEKVRANAETMQGWAEEVVRRRQLEERMEQLQAEKERLLYDIEGGFVSVYNIRAVCSGLSVSLQ